MRRATSGHRGLLAPLRVAAGPTGLRAHPQEAGKAVSSIERLQASFGTLAYDEEVADDCARARQRTEQGLIAREGECKARGWKAALDATMRGYLAGIPQSEIDALFAELRQRLAKSLEDDGRTEERDGELHRGGICRAEAAARGRRALRGSGAALRGPAAPPAARARLADE